MPRLRDPDSLKDVCAQFRVLLGPRATEIIGRSPSVLHKAADPDDEYMLTVNQMLALDEACAITCGVSPFYDYQTRRAGQAKLKRVESPGIAMLDAEVAMGKLAASLRAAVETTSSQGERLSANESCAIKQAAAKVMAELQDVMNSVTVLMPADTKRKGRGQKGRQ